MADETTGADEQSSISFAAFVLSLAHTAAVHFGDIHDPVSGEQGEMNLQAAAQMIDILMLIDEKTKGNLRAEERQMLDSVLYELRLRFVDATRGTPPSSEPKSRIIIP
ncbi:MAG: DUF1844 domain-containing protein [Acidobacteria bacterium]|nr:DUF1844 domain-containing protein [Acidobacteriota bacterium]